MVDPIEVVREERVRAALALEPMTMPRLLARGGSWRTVLNLSAEGELEMIGSTPTARPIWALVSGANASARP